MKIDSIAMLLSITRTRLEEVCKTYRWIGWQRTGCARVVTQGDLAEKQKVHRNYIKQLCSVRRELRRMREAWIKRSAKGRMMRRASKIVSKKLGGKLTKRDKATLRRIISEKGL